MKFCIRYFVYVFAFTLVFIRVPVFAQSPASPHFTTQKSYEKEIGRLAKSTKVKQVFAAIEALEPRTRADHIMLTEIPAPPFGEERRARKFAEMLQEAGADSVWIDEEGNVLALRKGKKHDRIITLDGHLDTVFPEGTDVTVQTRGDTLFAPGIGDDTRGLIVVLTVLRALTEAQIKTSADVLFIGTVGEEGTGDLRGMKHLFRDGGPKIDAWISIDGGNMERIVTGGLGSHRYRVTFRGPGGHSWGSFGLVNPHHSLGAAIQYFTQAADKYTAEGARTSYNVGRLGGGTSINAIPFESWMEVDMRSESDARLNGIDSLFQIAVKRALDDQNRMRRRGPELEVEVEMIGDRPSGRVSPDAPLVQRALAAAQFFGATPSLRTASTNSNIPISMGVPAVTLSRGGAGGGAHSPGEWWLNKDGHLAIQNALLILLAEAGLAK